ncbi:MAG: uracil-DNA glycosylase [Spirochaetales bacterium]|nr:uracil-DNA glycosylase [Spirochaetales bacterium]
MADGRNTDLTQFLELVQLVEDFYKSGFKSTRQAGNNIAELPPAELKVDRTLVRPERTAKLEELYQEIKTCTKCDLHFNRLHTVPGEGVFNPLIMVIGEAPGQQEDKIGRPFVGKAGIYLDKWLKAINVDRYTNCYIGNVIKCRPPENRDPHPEEIAVCLPYLERQLELLKPKFLLTVGRISSQTLIGSTKGIGSLRGGTYFYKHLPLVPTFHPSAVLRNQSLRGAVWEDLKLIRALMK